MIRIERFHEFEENNNLFDIRDNNGVYVWDIIRYKVYSSSMNYSGLIETKTRQKWNARFYSLLRYIWHMIRALCHLFLIIIYRNRHYDYVCYSCGRKKQGEKYVDQHIIDPMNLLGQNHCLVIESFGQRKKMVYNTDIIYSFPKIFTSFSRVYFDFSQILEKIYSDIPECIISEQELLTEYRRFYVERSFYRWFLHGIKPKALLLVQNGILKGLLAACKDLSIPVCEFQHGQINKQHPNYSYPNIELENKIYHPQILFTYSKHWCHDMNVPKFVKVVSVGNNYNYIDSKCNKLSKTIIVISNNLDGGYFCEFVRECLSDRDLIELKFIFKLHPNQFSEYNYYKKQFNENERVEIISDQKSVPQLLEQCSTMMLVQSTAAYEALQSGLRVCVFKIESGPTYRAISDIFDHKNVYLISTMADFKRALSLPIEDCKDEEKLFMTFDKQVFLDTIKIYE